MMVLTAVLIAQQKRIRTKECSHSMSVGMVTNLKKQVCGMVLQHVYKLERLFWYKALSRVAHGQIKRYTHNMLYQSFFLVRRLKQTEVTDIQLFVDQKTSTAEVKRKLKALLQDAMRQSMVDSKTSHH
jgi:hypothetical protein